MKKHTQIEKKEKMVLKSPNLNCNKKLIFVLLFSMILVLSLNNLSAATKIDVNASLEKNASECLNSSRVTMNLMASEGFSIARVNDTLKQAELTFAVQVSQKAKAKPYDFYSIIIYCNDIKKIYDSAVVARDEINSLLKFYNESVIKGMNTSSIDAILREIDNEMRDQRYEKVSPLIDKAYSEIINVQSSYSALNVFYANTAKGFKAFLLAKNTLFQIKNIYVILILLAILIFLYLLYRIKIQKALLHTKMDKLQIRKKTIKELVMKTQRDYFQFGKISEGDYNIKVKKFAELIRDIGRQIPLIQEQLAKLERVRSVK